MKTLTLLLATAAAAGAPSTGRRWAPFARRSSALNPNAKVALTHGEVAIIGIGIWRAIDYYPMGDEVEWQTLQLMQAAKTDDDNTARSSTPMNKKVLASVARRLKADNDSDIVIVLGATSTEGERHAVSRLHSLLQLPVVSASDAKGRRQISVGSQASLKLIPDLALQLGSLGDEGFILQTSNDAQSVAITGGVNAPRGCMYGAYRFMELVGFEFLSFDVTNVPASMASAGELWHGPMHRREVPVLEWRHNNNANLELQEHVNFSIAMGNNQNGGLNQYTSQDVHKPGGGVRWAPMSVGTHVGGFTETSFDLVPPTQYFPTNPEWFAGNCTVGAKGCHGGAGNQLCWGNQSLQAFLAQRAISFLRADPHANLVAIEQNDERGSGPRPCMRAADLAIFEEEGSWSGPLLRAVNYVADAVAAAFPERKIRVSTLAYVHTQDPPKRTVPRDNVVIRLVGWHCGWGIPLENGTTAGDFAFMSQLRGWSKLLQQSSGQLWIWTWNTDFDAWVLPWPDYYSTSPNTRLFLRHGVTGAYQEGQFMAYGGDMQEMKSWVGMKILWDPSEDDKVLISQFLNGWYCGSSRRSCSPAASVQRHIDLYHTSFLSTASSSVFLSKGEAYSKTKGRYLTPRVVLAALENLRTEQNKLDSGSSGGLLPPDTVRERLQRVELGSLFVLLLRWTEMHQWASENSIKWPAEHTVDAAFERFASWYRKFGMDKRIGYRDSAQGIDIDYGLSSQHYGLQWLNETVHNTASTLPLKSDDDATVLKTCNVLDYSTACHGDGVSNCTDAFQRAVSDCATHLGVSQLHVPQGVFLTAPFKLSGSGWDGGSMHVEGTILAHKMGPEWPAFTKELRFIRLSNISGFKLTGAGVVDGQGEAWWEMARKNEHSPSISKARPPLVGVDSVNGLIINSITLRNSPRFHLPIDRCQNVTIDGITISSPHDAPNTDGIDLGDSTNIVVRNNRIVNGDDNVAAGSGSSNILVEYNYFANGHGTSIGSLGFNFSIAHVSNVTVRHNIFNRTSNVARIKTWQGGRGICKNITYTNLTLIDVDNAILIDQFYCPGSQKHPDGKTHCKNWSSAVQVSDILFSDIVGTHRDDQAGRLACSETVPCNNIHLVNVQLTRTGNQSDHWECSAVHGSMRNCVPKPCNMNTSDVASMKSDDIGAAQLQAAPDGGGYGGRGVHSTLHLKTDDGPSQIKTDDLKTPPPRTVVFGTGVPTPRGPLSKRVMIPRMLLIPPSVSDDDNGNETLLVACEDHTHDTIALRRSTSAGESWSEVSFPVNATAVCPPRSAGREHGNCTKAKGQAMADAWCNQPAQSGCGTCTELRVARDSGAFHNSHPQWRCYCPECLTKNHAAYNSTSNCKQYCTQPAVIAGIASRCKLPSPPQPGVCTSSIWAEPSLLWDPSTESVLLSYTRIDHVLGGCDSNVQNEVGLFILSSTDRGLTFGQPQQPKLVGAPSSCLTPTGGVVISRGPHSGRKLYMLPKESYGGEVVAFSDGENWRVSPSLFSPGLDEANVAQTSNGSLFAVMRNCFTKAGGVTHGCSLEADDVGKSSAGPSAHRVAISRSNDGGENWTKPRLHSDLVTPTCQSSLLQHRDTLLFVGPRSETSRSNLTVLASDDNGMSFRRSLQLVPGQSGYSAIACGLPLPLDCAVLFDAGGALEFLKFDSRTLKNDDDGGTSYSWR